MTRPEPPAMHHTHAESGADPLPPVRGELWHQIEIDHEVYLTIIQGGPAGDLNARLFRRHQLDPPPHPAAHSPHEPSRAARQLTARACGAAEYEDPYRITDPALAHNARTAARTLADLLGTELADITAGRDQRIAFGQQPVLLLAVTDGVRHHEFSAPCWQSDGILAVLPCPACAHPVTTCLIPDLAAYGTLLATLPPGAIAVDERRRLLGQVADEFYTDPGHAPTCRYHPDAEQTGNQNT